MTGIYARQSVNKKGSISIEGQIELCRAECRGDECLLFQDKGFSGKNTRRPSFERMMEAVRAGEIQRIIVYRLDRFSRSIADFGRLWDTLQKYGVEFISVNERFDTSTPMGRAMLHIIMVFAQLERETISERIRDNYYQRARRREWVGGSPPFGFSVGRLTEGNGKESPTLIANHHADTVRRIYHDYAQEDASLGSIAKKLTEEGVACGKRPAWDNVSVSRILHNPLYVMASPEVREYLEAKGYLNLPPPDDFDGEHACQIIGRRSRAKSSYSRIGEQQVYIFNHSGIIPARLWLCCQHKLERNRQIKNSGKGTHSWLTGLMKCMQCGYSVKITAGRGQKYLSCSGRSNYRICPQSFHLSLDEIEQAAAAEMERIFSGCRAAPPNGSTSKLQEELDAIEGKISRLVNALADGTQNANKYIHAEIQRLDQQKFSLIQADTASAQPDPPQASGLNFSRLEFEQKKLAARRVIDKVLLDTDGIQIIWKI